jgi:hypothetical protein
MEANIKFGQSDDEADLEMMSAVLKFLNSLATASAVRPSMSSSSESAPDCKNIFKKIYLNNFLFLFPARN